MLAENSQNFFACILEFAKHLAHKGFGQYLQKKQGPLSFKDLFTWDFTDNTYFRDTGGTN